MEASKRSVPGVLYIVDLLLLEYVLVTLLLVETETQQANQVQQARKFVIRSSLV